MAMFGQTEGRHESSGGCVVGGCGARTSHLAPLMWGCASLEEARWRLRRESRARELGTQLVQMRVNEPFRLLSANLAPDFAPEPT